MKKVVSLLLCMMLLFVASSALAYNPGDTVTVTVSITSATAATARITVDASNDDVLIFQSATKTMAGMGFAPQKDGAAFTVISADMVSPVPTGVVGTVTYKIANDAPAGKYSIRVVGEGVTASGSTTVVVGCKDHTWDDGVVKTNPTCEKEGEKVFTCTACGETKTEAIAKVDHNKDVVKILIAATCTDPGAEAYYCSMCNQQQGSPVAVPATGHKPGSAEVAQQPTCTEPGLQSYTCTVCGAKIEGEVIPALGHTEVVVPGKAPTCTEPGKTEGKYCSVCNVVLAAQTDIPALGHNKVNDPAVAATCTMPGKTAGSHCATCNTVFEAQEEIPALGHTEVVIPGTPATCTKPGLSDGKKCSVCGEVTVQQTELEKLPHTPNADAVIIKPTCTEDGSETYTCTVCGQSVSGNKIPALGHKWDEGTVTVAPTCSKSGVKTFVCQNDNTHTRTETIAKTGVHVWDEGTVITAPTCTSKGKTTYACIYEGCSKTKTETVPALGHNYDEGVVVTEVTCEKDGKKVYTCQNDASHTRTETIKKLGHDWSEWVIVQPATDKENGLKERTCARCGKVQTQVISNRQDYQMTVCTLGIRFRDLPNPITDAWYMFTPIDISVDGVQTLDLIAGNMHRIGVVTIVVKEGTVTVSYELNNKGDINLYEEFMTILPSLDAAGKLDFDAMTNYSFDKAISIEEDLGGDTNVLLLVRNRAMYQEGTRGVEFFNKNGKDYKALVAELMQMMD